MTLLARWTMTAIACALLASVIVTAILGQYAQITDRLLTLLAH